MDFSSIKGNQETLCIKVPKVYDWVTRQADVPVISFNDVSMLDFDCGGAPTPAEDPCAVLQDEGNLTVECILTDEEGNPVDPLAPGSVTCVEIPQPGGRQDVNVTLASGETVTLQKVKVLKKGFFVLRVTSARGNSCTSAPQPFAVAEKFFLCAPEGTFLQCEITDFECDASLMCRENPDGTQSFQQLDVSINMCQNIQMEAIVKLEITADICQPRPEIPFVCPPLSFPPQCPEVFPGNVSNC